MCGFLGHPVNTKFAHVAECSICVTDAGFRLPKNKQEQMQRVLTPNQHVNIFSKMGYSIGMYVQYTV